MKKYFRYFIQLTMLSIGIGLMIHFNDKGTFLGRAIGFVLLLIALDWRYRLRDE